VRQARLARRYGAAVIVMAFDEKVRPTASRAASTSAGAATASWSAKSASRPGYRFDRTSSRWPRHRGAQQLRPGLHRGDAAIRASCRTSRFSGGVSNVSFLLRGNDAVRAAIHTVFLYHAIRAA